MIEDGSELHSCHAILTKNNFWSTYLILSYHIIYHHCIYIYIYHRFTTSRNLRALKYNSRLEIPVRHPQRYDQMLQDAMIWLLCHRVLIRCIDVGFGIQEVGHLQTVRNQQSLKNRTNLKLSHGTVLLFPLYKKTKWILNPWIHSSIHKV